jgi:predicted ArsR family transcriptional regulator
LCDGVELRHVVLDSNQLRCLAHPLRSRLLAALRLEGPATSAGLAVRLNTNTGATSYHLRQLAAVGLIEDDAQLGEGRERYWRATHDVTNWTETSFADDPDERAAADWLTGHHLRLVNRWREDWVESRMEWSEEWRAAASLGDMRVRLTPAQTREMVAELEAVVERWASVEQSHDSEPAPSTADVFVLLDVFPAHQATL